MGYVRLDIKPETVYHYTKKENLPAILRDGKIKRYCDLECWFCLSLQDALRYMELTVMKEGKSYFDSRLKIQTYPPFRAEDYVLLELHPIASEKYNWVTWEDTPHAEMSEEARREAAERTRLKVGFRANLRFHPEPKVYDVAELLNAKRANE